jgi:hypothetical protein
LEGDELNNLQMRGRDNFEMTIEMMIVMTKVFYDVSESIIAVILGDT